MSASGVHYMFLRSIPRQAPPSLRLYHGSWSHGRALLSCAWNDDAAAIRAYLSLCRERAGEFSDHLEESLPIGSMFGAEDPCVSVASPHLGERTEKLPLSSPPGVQEEGSKGRSLRRMKRGFIVPGTLWCGSGNKAPSFGDLGRLLVEPPPWRTGRCANAVRLTLVCCRPFHRNRQLLPGTRPVQEHHSVLPLPVWCLQQQHLHHVSLRL